ncbi:MAG: hypothetical protein ACRETO_02310 [Gammaproteobacteria bacterium]
MDVRFATCAILWAVLAGCASTSELKDQPFKLSADQGIAAIVLNAPHRITQIAYAAKDKGGTSFEVPDTDGGPTLYLVPVHAGRYCLKHFRYWQVVFNSTEDLGCLTVVAGHITYGGDIVPSIQPDQAVTDQQFNVVKFTGMLHKGYPLLSQMYPLAVAPAPPANVDATPSTYAASTWIQNIPGTRTQGVYFQNNTSWTLELTNFYMLECKNTTPDCGTIKLNIRLAPFGRKQLLVVKPTAQDKAYEYRYDYDLINAD